MKIRLNLFLVFILLSRIMFSQEYKNGDSLKVNAIKGLNLRSNPSINSNVVRVLNYGDEITVLKIEKEKKYNIGKIECNWVKIVADSISGYVIDGYLTKLPMVQKYANGINCFYESLKIYAQKNFTKEKFVNYHNGYGGESYHEMDIIQYEEKHQLIEHSYWESQAHELQLVNIREIEARNIIKTLLWQCEMLSADLEKTIFESHNYSIRKDDINYDISIKNIENRVIIKVIEGM